MITISLSLVSHTNVGKTTLMRTLLREDVGEVADRPHVTEAAEAGVLAETPEGDRMRLWDTPGLGDSARLLNVLAEVKSGEARVEAPLYSHFHYDILPGQTIVIERPDILIVEGLNVLQPARPPVNGDAIPFVSDFFDFSIYLDAEEPHIEEWYVQRFLRLRDTVFQDPESYFKHFAHLTHDQAVHTAREIWRSINGKNLKENILPTRRAKDTFQILDTSSNKFTLLTFTL